MGTIAASRIIDKVQIILMDEAGVRWPDATELLGWLNDGQREVLVYKPNAHVHNEAVQLAAGTKQTLPEVGVQLIDIPRNMGSDGTKPGRVIRIVSREVLDAAVPNWHGAKPSAECRHYMYNPLDPKRFYVYPPQPSAGMGYVEMVYAAVPEEVLSLTAPISLDDIYQNALIDYVLYRAYSKDTDYAADPSRAGTHQAAFVSSLTGKTQAEVILNPNTAAPANTQSK